MLRIGAWHSSALENRRTRSAFFSLIRISLPILLLIGCAPPLKVNVVMHLRPDQEDLFRTRILKPFEKKHHCIVQVQAYEDPATLPELLSAADTVDLVNPPLSMTRTLV